MKHYADTYEPETARGHAVALFIDADARTSGDTRRDIGTPGAIDSGADTEVAATGRDTPTDTDRGVVLDLGCGHGTIAEVLTERGFTYVGIDIDRDALAHLSGRGFESHEVSLSASEDDLVDLLSGILAGRPLAGVFALDVFEHLATPSALVRAVRRVSADSPGCQLVVSMPNVTHYDVGAKLLIGRWDPSEEGLLDNTHLQFFSEAEYLRLFAEAGWGQVAADDVSAMYSDQCFPADAPVLRTGAPLHDLLWQVRSWAEPHGTTYQFVRSFKAVEPVAVRPPAAITPGPGSPSSATTLATVVIVDDGGVSPEPLLADLAAMDDIEALGGIEVVLVRRAIHDAVGDTDDGADQASGLDVGVREVADEDTSESHDIDDGPDRTSGLDVPAREVADDVTLESHDVDDGLVQRSGLDVVLHEVADDTTLASGVVAACAAAEGRAVCVMDASCRVLPGWLGQVAHSQEHFPGIVSALGVVAVGDDELAQRRESGAGEVVSHGRAVVGHRFDLLTTVAEAEVAVASFVLPRALFDAAGLALRDDEGDLAWFLLLHRAVMISGHRMVDAVAVVVAESEVERFAPRLDAFVAAITPEPLLFGAGSGAGARIAALHQRLAERDTEVVGLAEQSYSLGFHLEKTGHELDAARAEVAELRDALAAAQARHESMVSLIRRKIRR